MVGALTLAAMVAVIAGMVAIAALPSFDMRLLVVLSGSMEPTIATGDAVIVREVADEDVRVGDVITYLGYGSDRLTTHRVIDVRDVDGQRHFRTQGDANESPDPNLAPAGGLEGRVELTLPGLGWAALEMQRPVVRLVGLSLPAAMLAAGAVRDLVALRGSRGGATPASRPRRRVHSPVQLSVAGGVAAVAIGVLGAATSLAVYVDSDQLGANGFSTLAVSPPTGVTAEMDCGLLTLGKGVVVSWDAAPDAGGYQVLRSTTSGGPYDPVATVDAGTTSHKDTSVANSTTYHYVVRTTAGTWSSADSTQVSVTTPSLLSCSLL